MILPLCELQIPMAPVRGHKRTPTQQAISALLAEFGVMKPGRAGGMKGLNVMTTGVVGESALL